ncbi:hypothetical protein BO85DRAFT_485299 [Aspergillus piperis CBS 112811]|uniref:Uncharacterized protein n=1 Tax=Aspergillus piperis CBS 112811 TaxID=1448313 RepID=A0A8G1VNQ1_9EURO|nr:hypothetical protein BO85DRAFT_485299 [Aspergillus piperis CBS 112811]RAH60139.1 hypothetical protein BO85DRAFT_485299 [Aspergillus piperis CBS 112811]
MSGRKDDRIHARHAGYNTRYNIASGLMNDFMIVTIMLYILCHTHTLLPRPGGILDAPNWFPIERQSKAF